MRRLYILFFAVLSIVCSHAAQLSPQQALERAINSPRFAKARLGGVSFAQPVLTGKCADGMAAYYVFTNSSSTLFVSADDVARPVLGYTDSGNFDPDNIAPAMQWWLDGYTREIEWAVQNDVEYKSEPATMTGGAIEPMLSTLWNQSYPYNGYCPVEDGYYTVAGCVAISVSQTMNYFKWPKDEVESISYQWNNELLTSPALTIDWDHMLDDYMQGYDDTEFEAVSRFIQCVGYAVHTNYDTSWAGGSSAYSADIRPALVNVFGYDEGITYFYRDYFETDEWEQMIYDNLANCGPVIYDGQGSSGRHSFVCDGYNGNGMFHINWGWGGSSNGYYTLSALNPPSLGIGGAGGGYNYYQGAVFGIRPPQENSKAAEAYIVCNNPLEVSLQGRRLKFGEEGKGFYNFGPVAGQVTFGAEFENVATGDIEYSVGVTIDLEPDYGIYYYTLTLPQNLHNGIYKVSPRYKVADGEWRRVLFYVGDEDHVMIKVKNGDISFNTTVSDDPDVAVTDWYLMNNRLVAGESYLLTVRVENSYTVPKDYTLTASLCQLDGETYTEVVDLGTRSNTIEAFNEITMRFSGTLPDIKSGMYRLVLMNEEHCVVNDEIEVQPGIGSVEAIEVDEVKPDVIYDLTGRAVVGQPAPGIYVINGVKTVIR